MTIAWQHFTPSTALAGGLLIGAAAVWMMLALGRIAGVSGVLGGLLHLRPAAGERPWRIGFLAGLIAAPLIAGLLGIAVGETRIEAGTGQLVAAGLLVGLGTRYGSGCTSGHGVCGVARFSPRSLVATICFTASGMATVYLLRHLLATGA